MFSTVVSHRISTIARTTAICTAVAAFSSPTVASTSFYYQFADTYDEVCGVDNEEDGCAEISAFDAQSERIYTINGQANGLRVLQVVDQYSLRDVGLIDLSDFGAAPNSVAVSGSVVAVAMEAANKQSPGVVALFDTQTLAGLGSFLAGALPDMVTFTPDGRYLLVANEGEPSDDYADDPEGSITIIDMETKVTRTADFSAYATLTDESVRIFGPGATVAQDLEPEYIAVSSDSTTAWISLQENNALATLDIESATITAVKGLGFKDHSVLENAFDASNRDGGIDCSLTLENAEQCINIQTHPTLGMYQPDAIATYEVDGLSFIVSANEGDARDYDGYSEELRVGDDEFILDATKFVDASALKLDSNLGRLKTTNANGDTDGDGDYDAIYTFGARSFSIWNSESELVFDSGAHIENTLAQLQADGLDVWTDGRSDDKGPEPESVTVGVLDGRSIAFIGLERVSGILAYDITDPLAPAYLGYMDTKRAGDISPEGLIFEPRGNNNGLLIVTNEVSNTTSTYRVSLDKTGSASTMSAAPTVSGTRISWQSDDYYQVQTSDVYTVICEGANLRQCDVSPGAYNVINLSTGERYENIIVN